MTKTRDHRAFPFALLDPLLVLVLALVLVLVLVLLLVLVLALVLVLVFVLRLHPLPLEGEYVPLAKTGLICWHPVW
jgi:hypothetical protein